MSFSSLGKATAAGRWSTVRFHGDLAVSHSGSSGCRRVPLRSAARASRTEPGLGEENMI
jgi:hypothetical protein